MPRESHELLSASPLSAGQYARWIDFRRRSDSLDAAAIDDLSGVAIQTAVLTLSAVAEGLHRRLFDGKARMPAYSAADLKRARRAARSAALETVRIAHRSDRQPLTDSDIDELKTAMNEAFSFINEMTFRTRMADLATTAQRAIPNIVAAFADWPAAVRDARNTLAHQLTRRPGETIDQFYDLLIALSYSIAWVLRTVLLLRAGFSVEALQRAYEESSAYNHHITNTRELLVGSSYAAQ